MRRRFARLRSEGAFASTWRIPIVVKGRGRVTGGMTNFEPPSEGYFYIDHDQRDTLAAGAEAALPWHCWASVNLNYGSGFFNVNWPSPPAQPPNGRLSF